jgi:hypothetical protein
MKDTRKLKGTWPVPISTRKDLEVRPQTEGYAPVLGNAPVKTSTLRKPLTTLITSSEDVETVH